MKIDWTYTRRRSYVLEPHDHYTHTIIYILNTVLCISNKAKWLTNQFLYAVL